MIVRLQIECLGSMPEKGHRNTKQSCLMISSCNIRSISPAAIIPSLPRSFLNTPTHHTATATHKRIRLGEGGTPNNDSTTTATPSRMKTSTREEKGGESIEDGVRGEEIRPPPPTSPHLGRKTTTKTATIADQMVRVPNAGSGYILHIHCRVRKTVFVTEIIYGRNRRGLNDYNNVVITLIGIFPEAEGTYGGRGRTRLCRI